jgi:invasion protein IalB
MKTLPALTLLFTCLMSASVNAQTLQLTSKQWSVFTMNDAGRTSCYMASIPTAQSGNYKSRAEPFLLITHRSVTADEVNTSSGYPYKDASEVALTLDGAPYKLFTKEDRAWAKDATTDAALVSKMKQGTNVTIRGTSKRGTYSLDTYSLAGFTAAYQKMKTLCK